METQDKRLRVTISEQELLCKNGCGFYGTPQWNGLCSKCWRLYNASQKRAIDYNKNRSLLSSNDRSDEQRSPDSRGLRFKSILKKSPSMFSPSTSENVHPVTHSNSVSTLQSQNTIEIPYTHAKLFNVIAEYFGQSQAKEVDRQCRLMLEKLYQNALLPLDELSDMIQNFYQAMKDRVLRMKPIKHHFDVSVFMSELEEYVCTQAYDVIFSDRSDEEIADISMQDRIRSLHWVTSGFLETALDFSILSVHEAVDDAITFIIELNQYHSAQEKLRCLVSCSKSIFEALKHSRNGAPASADEFLPALIYVILRSNPPLILSNMKFISRFALQHRIMLGESGYYFTNLSCALQFIQDMNADSLQMDKEQFEAYTSGKLAVPIQSRECERNWAIKTIENGLHQLDALVEQQQQLDDRITAFSQEMEAMCDSYSEEVKRFLDCHPRAELRSFCQALHGIEVPEEPPVPAVINETSTDEPLVDNTVVVPPASSTAPTPNEPALTVCPSPDDLLDQLEQDDTKESFAQLTIAETTTTAKLEEALQQQ
uniref:Rab5 GDP/GTP exchange factor n=1 Tax=Panagrellus redivivus TaxID=6233 RepID=A0A7E4VN54_PANRE